MFRPTRSTLRPTLQTGAGLNRSGLPRGLAAGALAAVLVLTGACGHMIRQKAATGAVAGAVIAGPVGAAVGGAAGAVVGQSQKPD